MTQDRRRGHNATAQHKNASASELKDRGQQRADELKDQAQQRADELKDRVQEQAGPAATKAQEQIVGRLEGQRTTAAQSFGEVAHAMRQTSQQMRDASGTVHDVRFSTMDTIKRNPIPAAMVVAGLGWLFMNHGSRPSRERYEQYTSHHSDRYRGARSYGPGRPVYRDEDALMGARGAYPMSRQQDEGMLAQSQRRVGEAAQRAQSAAGGAVDQAQDAVAGAASRAQETAGALAGRTAYAADRVDDRVRSSMHTNPLAVGALALAAGAAAGFALPQTERENQLLGEARDDLMEQARDTMSEAVDKAQKVTGEVAQDVQQKTTEKVREVGLTSGQ